MRARGRRDEEEVRSTRDDEEEEEEDESTRDDEEEDEREDDTPSWLLLLPLSSPTRPPGHPDPARPENGTPDGSPSSVPPFVSLPRVSPHRGGRKRARVQDWVHHSGRNLLRLHGLGDEGMDDERDAVCPATTEVGTVRMRHRQRMGEINRR